jgi:hypothetical protein
LQSGFDVTTAYHWTQRQIFNEKTKMHGNTVNGCFAAGAAAPVKNCGNRSIAGLAQFNYWRSRKAVALALLPSIRPCLKRAVDGIFRPGGGSPGWGSSPDFQSAFPGCASKASWGDLPVSKNQSREAISR